MKKKLFIIAVLAIGMTACLGSCKKKTTEPTTDPTTDPTEEYVCTHDSLVHVMAVEPTAEENGCIEHYLCPDCLATFADAQGTMPIDNTILWATNYLVEEDISEIENYLSQFAGGENGYMYDICLNTISGSGGEGSLWDDYTGWENWTDEQWQAYWDCMHQYYIEWGGDEAIGTSNAFDVAAFFITRVLTKTLDAVDNGIEAFFNPNYEIEKKLDNIMLKLDNIQNSIIALANKMTMQVYKDRMQARYERQVPLGNATTSYFREVLQLVAKEKKPYSQCSAETKAKIQTLAEEWHSQVVNGNNIELEFKNMLDFFKGDFSTGTNMPAVYEYIAEHSFAWAHKGGYELMETARAVDAVLMSECYVMNVLYHKTHTSPQFLLFKPINCSMEAYAKTLSDNPIKRYDGCLVCQIPGAKVIVYSGLKNVIMNHYFIDGKTLYCDKDGFEDLIKYQSMFRNGTVDSEWYTKIVQYYKDKGEQQTGKNYLYNKLSEIGFGSVPTWDNDWIVANDNSGETHTEDKFTYRMFTYVPNQYNDCWIGYNTVIKKDKGGRIFKKAQVNMNIEKNNYGRFVVEKTGNYTKEMFYAIELYKE